jgi:hypothetical protein
MANEFKIKNGLIVQGPLTASFAYTTASWALNTLNAVSSSYAVSASHADIADLALTATSASYALSASHADSSDTALTATSASYALSASNALSSSNAFSASYAGTASVILGTVTSASFATTSSHAITSSNLVGWNFQNTGSILGSANTQSVIISVDTGSYLAAFFDYAAVSESNSRCGTIFGSWVNGSITYAEVSNVDVGDTSQVTMSLGLNGGLVELSASISDTTPWTIRALARYI